MKYSETKTGDWLKIKGRPINNIYIKAQDNWAYCIDSLDEDDIGEILEPDDNTIVEFVSHFWLHNFDVISIFERAPIVDYGEDYIPPRFIVKYPNGDRYYITISLKENLYLSFASTENNDFLLLGRFENIKFINLKKIGFIDDDIKMIFNEPKKLRKE